MPGEPAAEPQGLVYRPQLISAAKEAELLSELGSLRWDPIILHGRTARRSARHFGLDYDYEARAPHPGEPIPDWLRSARERAARLAGYEPEQLVEILVQRYPAGSAIGWHRDAPAFGIPKRHVLEDRAPASAQGQSIATAAARRTQPRPLPPPTLVRF